MQAVSGFFNGHTRDPAKTAALFRWIASRSEPARDIRALIAWAKKRKNPHGALLAAVEEGYANEKIPEARR